MWVSERTKGQLCCRRRNEPIFQEKFKRRILEMLSKTAIAISSFHLAYIFLNKSKYSFKLFQILFLEKLWKYFEQKVHYHSCKVCIFFYIVTHFKIHSFLCRGPSIFVKSVQLYKTCPSRNVGLLGDLKWFCHAQKFIYIAVWIRISKWNMKRCSKKMLFQLFLD